MVQDTHCRSITDPTDENALISPEIFQTSCKKYNELTKYIILNIFSVRLFSFQSTLYAYFWTKKAANIADKSLAKLLGNYRVRHTLLIPINSMK